MIRNEELKTKMMTSNVSLQMVYNSIHSGSFQNVDFGNLQDSYYVGMSDHGVYFDDRESSSYLPIGTISANDMLFIKELNHM